jgi:rhodanese-related sulfurtransferase
MAMIAPLEKLGYFGDETSLVIAFAIGIGFGFFLERAGFGSAKKLVAQFYLRDLAVFKVMFSAIVTAMLGVTYLAWTGVLDLDLVYLVPTYWVAQLIGGLVLGAGFVIGGYCPGTSIASASTGRLDGIVFVLGFAAGTAGFAVASPLLSGLLHAGELGRVTVPDALGVGHGLVVFAVVAIAVAGFAGASWIEKHMAARDAASSATSREGSCMRRWLANRTFNQKLGAVALVLGAAALAATVRPGRTVSFNAKDLLTRIEREDDHVTPAELATWIIEGRADYRLIDIRGAAAFAAYHIPTAEHIPLSQIADGALARTDKIILYGDGGIHAAQGWMVLTSMGYHRAYSLREGLDAWKDEVLYPTAPEHPTPEVAARFERVAQIARFFGGQVRAAAPAAAAPSSAVVPGPAAVAPQPPVLVSPPPPPAAGPGGPAKKKREGC